MESCAGSHIVSPKASISTTAEGSEHILVQLLRRKKIGNHVSYLWAGDKNTTVQGKEYNSFQEWTSPT